MVVPVVFIPGILSSVPTVIFGKNSFSFGFSKFIYQPFLDKIQDIGFEINKNFFICHYEWWEPNEVSAKKYLVPKIREATLKNGTKKVIIIAHSMGGLVARSYVQSDFYQRDVEKIIMLGTPNAGAANAYYPWQGATLSPSEYFDVFRLLLKGFLWIFAKVTGIQKPIEVVRKCIPSIKQLLPCRDYGDYLIEHKGDTISKITYDQVREKNSFLDELNKNAHLIKERGIDLFLISGKENYTAKFIQVDRRFTFEDDRWIDGVPVGEISIKEGDGTVLVDSVNCILGEKIIIEGDHTSILVGSLYNVADILGISSKDIKVDEIKKFDLEDFLSVITYHDAESNFKNLPEEDRVKITIFNKFDWHLIRNPGKNEYIFEVKAKGRDIPVFVDAYTAEKGVDYTIKESLSLEDRVYLNIKYERGKKLEVLR